MVNNIDESMSRDQKTPIKEGSEMSKQYAMDGATCLQTNSGSVAIGRNSFGSWVALVILGLVFLGLVAFLLSAIGKLLAGEATIKVSGLPFLIGIAAFLGAIILHLIRTVRRPSIYFNTGAKVMEQGRGRSARQIPFSSISRIAVDRNPGQGSLVGMLEEMVFASMNQKRMGVCVLLDSLETVQLGTVSGDKKKEKKLEERAEAIAQLIADATDAPMGDVWALAEERAETVAQPIAGPTEVPADYTGPQQRRRIPLVKGFLLVGCAASCLLVGAILGGSTWWLSTQPEAVSLYHNFRGIYYEYMAEDNDLAFAEYTKSIETFEIGPSYWSRARVCIQLGDITGALRDINTAIERFPEDNDPDYYLVRATIHWISSDNSGALNDIERAFQITPGYLQAYNLRALVYATQGHYEMALAEIDKALELQPSGARWLDTRGFIYLKSKQYGKAKADFEEIFNQDLEFPYALLGAGLTYEALGEYDKAEEMLERGLKDAKEVKTPDPQLTDLMSLAEKTLSEPD
jgi:tetratricopeptide (TPR) repeat protein